MLKDQLQQQIRYQIDQLSSLNGQTDFEKICLYFARQRIHLNILPATGPVQAGGDQGRDFETFHSYLATSPNASSYFIGKFSEAPVAFACSLEKNPVATNGKVYQDVANIVASGSNVERIYFFSGQDIPVAKRHKCQDALNKKYKIPVEIIDAQALSIQLTDIDLFWIAIQYLKMPSELYPREGKEGWYEKLLEEYKLREHVPVSVEEFAEIKSAVRHIYKDPEKKIDLPFWLSKLDLIITSGEFSESIKRKAIYERVVTTLLGLNEISGQEDNIRTYFSNLETYTHQSDIEDAQVLLSFCNSSARLIGHGLEESFLEDIANRLEILLKKHIEKVENIDLKCMLNETYAMFLLLGQPGGIKSEERFKQYVDQLTHSISWLSKSNFYPIERLSDRLNQFIGVFIKTPFDISDLESFAREVDEILVRKGGRAVVAEKLRTRALTYLKNDETLKALDCLHELKLKWFKHDTISGLIITCMLLGKCYYKLNLFHAAKQYFMFAAFMAFKSNESSLYHRIVEGISSVADCDYMSGSWLHFFDSIDFLLMLHFRITKDFDVYDNDDSVKILYHTSLAKKVAELLIPNLVSVIEQRIAHWGYVKDDIEEYKERVNERIGDRSTVLDKLNDELYGRAYNDIGSSRIVDFNALGCNWQIIFSNEYITNALAEQFIAMLQIAIADLSREELFLISGTIKLKITHTNTRKISWNRQPSNEVAIWEIYLSEFKGATLDQLHEHEFDYLVATQAILQELSLLPIENYKKVLGKKFKDNLISKMSFGRPYSELYQHFYSGEVFNKSGRQKIENDLYHDSYSARKNSQMPWNDSVAPSYDKLKSLEAIANRIMNTKKIASITLPKLLADDKFILLADDLRKRGFLDWQILHCVANLIINYKILLNRDAYSIERIHRNKESYLRDETLWYIEIPLSFFTEERLIQELTMMLPITMLHGFGLQQHAETPNGIAILELLRCRFNFFEDGKDQLVLG